MNTLLTFLWLGTAGLYLSDGTDALLIDPFVTRSGMLRVGMGFRLPCDTALVRKVVDSLQLTNVRAVIVTHSHYDHSMDAPEFVRRTGAPLVGSKSTMMVGRSGNLTDEQMREVVPGDELAFGAFSVTFIESRHGPALFGRVPYPGEIKKTFALPAPARSYRVGTIFSLLVRHSDRRIMIHSSAGFRTGMYDTTKADVLFLGLAGRGDTKEYLKHVLRPLVPRTVIPVHYDNFFRPLSAKPKDLFNLHRSEFLKAMEAYPDVRIAFPPFCRPVSLEDLPDTTQ